ncbi:MAG: FecR domain-containing protein [Bacteroidota bacterium]
MTDELLIKFLIDETDATEKTEVQEWLLADPANQLHLDQMEKIWQAGKKLAVASKVDEEQAWMRFKEKAAGSGSAPAKQDITAIRPLNPDIEPLKSGSIPLRNNYSWLKIAAILLLVGGSWMAYQLFGPQRYQDLVASDKVLNEQLPDGSELTLNKNTQLSYASNFKSHRSVKLTSGDVFFKVAHDKKHPFVIDIDKVSVTVVGTSFNIKHLNASTEIIVETGIVRVKLGDQKIELHKGEKVLIAGAAASLVKEANTDKLYTYYRSNLFVATNTPLGKLVATFNEAYAAEISFADPELANETISSTFPASKSLNENLETVCKTLDLKMERNENKILLSRLK